jgi:hypothetical protein
MLHRLLYLLVLVSCFALAVLLSPAEGQTPTPVIIYVRDGSIRANRTPLPPNKILCVIDGNRVGLCDAPSGGAVATPSGASCPGATFDEEVATDAGEKSVQTVATIPAGVQVGRCLARTIAQVNTALGFGYDLGMEGALSFHSENVSGAPNATNLADLVFPAPHSNYTAAPVWVSASGAGNTFSDDDGIVEVICFWTACAIPTLTPTP